MVHRAARSIGASAGHHRDADTSAVPDRRGEVGRLDAHLLDHVRIRRGGHLPPDAVVGGAVDRPVDASDTAERRRIGRGATDESLAGERDDASGHHAWGEPRKEHGHVRLQRQFGNLLLVEDESLPQRGRFQQRRLTGHSNFLGDGADFERELERELLTGPKRDAASPQRLEPLHFDHDLVVARDEQARFEIAAAVGDERLRHTGGGIDDFDSGAGYDALLVANGAGNGASGFLRDRRYARQQQQEADDHERPHRGSSLSSAKGSATRNKRA